MILAGRGSVDLLEGESLALRLKGGRLWIKVYFILSFTQLLLGSCPSKGFRTAVQARQSFVQARPSDMMPEEGRDTNYLPKGGG